MTAGDRVRLNEESICDMERRVGNQFGIPVYRTGPSTVTTGKARFANGRPHCQAELVYLRGGDTAEAGTVPPE